jgi:hypothetical protein
MHVLTQDEVPLSHLKIWVGDIHKALYACYGSSGVSKFADGGTYKLDIPPPTASQSNWVYSTLCRLEDLIKDEQPKEDEINVDNLPDAAFKC